jgi:hypothetical protein
VLPSNGDGTFNTALLPSFAASGGAVVAADFNGDGHADLCVADAIGETVTVALGKGDGTFRSQLTLTITQGQTPVVFAVQDFNGDGKLDVAAGFQFDGTVSIRLGLGNGTFVAGPAIGVGPDPDAIVAGAFTSDGHFDLAVADAGDNTVRILLGNGDGTFRTGQIIPVGRGPDALVQGDFNSDGNLDLAVANGGDNTVTILLGNGDGTFHALKPIPVGQGGPDRLVAQDFNNDGHLDLAVADQRDTALTVLLGKGDGTFHALPAIALAAVPDALVAGGFTNATFTNTTIPIPDLAVASQAAGTVTVLLGNGDGTFHALKPIPVGPNPDALTKGHFHGGNPLDLAVAGFIGPSGSLVGTDTVTVLLSNGDGTFKVLPTMSVSAGASPDALRAAQFTGSNHNDLLVGTTAGNVLILLGNANATFAAAQRITGAVLSTIRITGGVGTGLIGLSTNAAVTTAIFVPTANNGPPAPTTPAAATALGANTAPMNPAGSGSAAVAEAAATSAGSAPDEVAGQATLVGADLLPTLNPGDLPGANNLQAPTDIASSLIFGGSGPKATLLSQRKGAAGLLTSGFSDEEADDDAEAVTETDDEPVRSMIGLNDTPHTRRPGAGPLGRPLPPAVGKPRPAAPVPQPLPIDGRLPASRKGRRDVSLLNRLWTDPPQLVRALAAAGLLAGVHFSLHAARRSRILRCEGVRGERGLASTHRATPLS